jgi:hypothetical protein
MPQGERLIQDGGWCVRHGRLVVMLVWTQAGCFSDLLFCRLGGSSWPGRYPNERQRKIAMFGLWPGGCLGLPGCGGAVR